MSEAGSVPVGRHPAVDEFGEGYVVFASSSPTVRFTEPFAAFVAEAVARGAVPVLVTATSARVSAFVSLAMRDVGGVWALRARDGSLYDALSGRRVEALEDLWEPPPAGPVAGGAGGLPGFAGPPSASCQVVTFDVQTRQRAVDGSRVGAVADHLGGALGTSWRCWATREPLLDPWDAGAVTEAARRAMPCSPAFRVVGDGGAFCQVQVTRTSAGLAEHTVGGVPASSGTDLLAVVTEAAERLVAEHNPVLGTWSVADWDLVDGTVVHAPRVRVPEAPLVVLVGPAAARDLGTDADRLVAEHDVRRLGRARLPCLLARFDEPDPVRRWEQVARFAVTLGLGEALRAVGVEPG